MHKIENTLEQVNKPLLSIIVPIYNVEPYLLRCLESISRQTLSNFEAILVDDGSQDKGREICDSYAQKDTRFKVIHQVNGGISSARNSGVKMAQGQYLGFVDPDDYIAADMYERLLKEMMSKDADIVICDHFRLEKEGMIPRHGFAHDFVLDRNEAMQLIASDKLTSYLWCKLYKRNIFDQIYFPEGQYFEDLTVLHELFHAAEKIAYIHDCLYYYFINPKGIVATLTVQKEYDHFMAWQRRRIFFKKLYPELADYTYELFTYCGTRSYWLSRYCNDKKHAQEVRNILKSEAKAILTSPFVRMKNKIRLIEVLFKINLYQFYIPKAIRCGVESIVNTEKSHEL
ncbi:MAG: glycosyltransferase [Acidaminococcaceae bacterium]